MLSLILWACRWICDIFTFLWLNFLSKKGYRKGKPVLLPIEILRAFLRTPSPAERSRSERSEDPKCPEGTRSPHVLYTWGCEAQDTGGRWTDWRAGQIRIIGCCEATSERQRRTRAYPWLDLRDERRQKEGGRTSEARTEGWIFAVAKANPPFRRLACRRVPCASHLCVARRGYYLLFAEPSREKAGRSVYTQTAVASLRLAGIHSG